MRNPENIKEITALDIDWMGFIFYPMSKRYVGEGMGIVSPLVQGVRKVAVFVNESEEEVLRVARAYSFDLVQLHGTESPDCCQTIRQSGVAVIKAFGMDASFDWSRLTAYTDRCDFFLFDTSTPNYGGSGQKFDWKVLDNYTCAIPFLLSGGIGPNDSDAVKAIKHPYFAGIDLNSKFESMPAWKEAALLRKFINQVRS